VVCLEVLEFEPKITTPPIMAASATIIAGGSNLIAPRRYAKSLRETGEKGSRGPTIENAPL
jgi:hypothetical protein